MTDRPFALTKRHILCRQILETVPGDSKKCPAIERLLLPEYISNNILQYLIE